jgi:hypothetical protein
VLPPRIAARLLLLTIAGTLQVAQPAIAAGPGKVKVETVEFGGWKNNVKISNGAVELIVTLDVGPRVISYKLAGGVNVLKEFPDQFGKSGEPGFMIRGGHRLWVSPEDPIRTYAPDNVPVAHKVLDDGTVVFTADPDEKFGLRREISVKMTESGTEVRLIHRVENTGKVATELAPWALTVMKPGGVEIIPLPTKAPHGGAGKVKTAADFGASQSLVLWPYTDLADSRFSFGSEYILVRHDGKKPSTKIGLNHAPGWVSYLNDHTLFTKRFAYEPDATYPDRGCNFETYTDGGIVEIETLGPLVKLQPGQDTKHAETWSLSPVRGEFKGLDDVKSLILPLVAPR